METSSNISSDNDAGTGAGLLSWLGLSRVARKHDPVEPLAEPRDHDSIGANPVTDVYARMMDQISQFLLGNDLAITPSNLTLAHSIFSGIDPQLSKQVRARVRSGRPISQRWLDDVAESDNGLDSSQQYYQMMELLESNLDTFAASTKNAHSSTAAYGAHLAQQASKLSNLPEPDRIVLELLKLTETMLSRTRKIEDEMRRSESEAGNLRHKLAASRREAELDYLTKLPNRRAFDAILDKQFDLSKATRRPLSLAFCDIDFFKRVNDMHGHATGDRVLKAVADALAKISNDTCHVARHGGEEFVMLFVDQSADEAKAQLDGVREKFAARNFVNRESGQTIGSITFSAGVANALNYPHSRDVLKAADKSLYAAKHAGRNRVYLADNLRANGVVKPNVPD